MSETTAVDVTRYGCRFQKASGSREMVDHPDGEFVLFDDYQEGLAAVRDEMRTLRLHYAGVLGLLSEASPLVDGEIRDLIIRAFIDAEAHGFKWRRVLDRLEIEVAR